MLELIGPTILLTNRKGTSSPSLQLLLALRFYATGCFQNVCGDIVGVSKSTSYRTIHRVTEALCQHCNKWIDFDPTTMEQDKNSFFQMRGFPNVIGCIDGTQIPILAPSTNQFEYVCRKGFTSINIQLVCNSTLKFVDACVRFPGSVHDARILRESRLFQGIKTIYNEN